MSRDEQTGAVSEGKTSFRYDAFISYRHVEPDRTWAKWLHHALETYRTPRALVAKGFAGKLTRVFRDEEELPASSSLSTDIDDALTHSNFLIVVCSPRAPLSRWVNAEVERFRALGRHDRILALLVEGEPRDAFPAALCAIRTTATDASGRIVERVDEVEPLAADVRARPGESMRTLRRMAQLRLMACILGCRFDDLRQREQERQTRRTLVAGVALAVIALAMGVLAMVALQQRSAAVEARVRAEAERRSVALASAGASLDARAYVAARQTLSSIGEAYRQWPWKHLWLRSMSSEYVFTCEHPSGQRAKPWISVDGRTLLLDSEAGFDSVAIDLNTFEHAPMPTLAEGGAGRYRTIALSADGKRALLEAFSGPTLVVECPAMVVAATLGPKELGEDGRAIGLSRDGARVVIRSTVAGEDGKTLERLESVDVESKARRALYSCPAEDSPAWLFVPGPEEDRFLVVQANNATAQVVGGTRTAIAPPTALATGPVLEMSPDGSRLITVDSQSAVLHTLWTGESKPTSLGMGGNTSQGVRSAAWRKDGEVFALGCEDGRIRVYEAGGGTPRLMSVMGLSGAPVTALAFGPDGLLAGGGTHGVIRLWDIATGQETLVLRGHMTEMSALAFSPSGDRLFSVSADNRVSVWCTKPLRESLATTAEGAALLATLNKMVDEAAKTGTLAATRERLMREGTLGPIAMEAAEDLLAERAEAAAEASFAAAAGPGLVTFAAARDALTAVFENPGIALLRAIRTDGLRDEPELDEKGKAIVEIREHRFSPPAATVRSVVVTLAHGFERRVMIFDERREPAGSSTGGRLVHTFVQGRVPPSQGQFEVVAAGPDRFVVRRDQTASGPNLNEETEHWMRIEGAGVRSVLQIQRSGSLAHSRTLAYYFASERLSFDWLDERPTIDLSANRTFVGGVERVTPLFTSAGRVRLVYDPLANDASIGAEPAGGEERGAPLLPAGWIGARTGGRFVIDMSASDFTSSQLPFASRDDLETLLPRVLEDNFDAILSMYDRGTNDQRQWVLDVVEAVQGTPVSERLRMQLSLDRQRPVERLMKAR